MADFQMGMPWYFGPFAFPQPVQGRVGGAVAKKRFRGLNLRLESRGRRNVLQRGRYRFRVWFTDWTPMRATARGKKQMLVDAENSNAAAKKVVARLYAEKERFTKALRPNLSTYDFYLTSTAELNPDLDADVPRRTRFYHYEGEFLEGSEPVKITRRRDQNTQLLRDRKGARGVFNIFPTRVATRRRAVLVATNRDPIQQWLPFITVEESWFSIGNYGVQASFSFPAQMGPQVILTLQQRGYRLKRGAVPIALPIPRFTVKDTRDPLVRRFELVTTNPDPLSTWMPRGDLIRWNGKYAELGAAYNTAFHVNLPHDKTVASILKRHKYRMLKEYQVKGLARVNIVEGERFSVPFVDIKEVIEAINKVLTGEASIRSIQRQSMNEEKTVQTRINFIRKHLQSRE